MSFSRALSRKQFLALSAASAAAGVLQACGGNDNQTGTGGAAGTGGGTGGTGMAGTGGTGMAGTGGTGMAGTGGTGMAGTGTSGTGGSAGAATGGGAGTGSGGAAAGTGGTAGTGTAGSGAGGVGTAGSSVGPGGEGGMGGEDPMGGSCTADISVMSSGMHQHSLLVTAAQITAGTEVTILSGETTSHAHQVKITAADFTALKAGMEVIKKSCAGGDHTYVLKCGGGGSTPMDPTCSDECGGPDASSACP